MHWIKSDGTESETHFLRQHFKSVARIYIKKKTTTERKIGFGGICIWVQCLSIETFFHQNYKQLHCNFFLKMNFVRMATKGNYVYWNKNTNKIIIIIINDSNFDCKTCDAKGINMDAGSPAHYRQNLNIWTIPDLNFIIKMSNMNEHTAEIAISFNQNKTKNQLVFIYPWNKNRKKERKKKIQ